MARGDSKEEEGQRLGEYKAQSFDGDLFTFNVILATFLALLTLLHCRMYLHRGWLLELGGVCVAFGMAVCLQRFVRSKRTLSVMRMGWASSFSNDEVQCTHFDFRGGVELNRFYQNRF